MSSAISRPCARGRRRRSDRSRRACRGPARSPCARPPRRRSPTGCPDRPGPASASCSALAEAPADRMDRRQVEHVEAHRRDVGQPRRGFVERRAARRIGAGRAREHLVPRAEPRALALDDAPSGRGRSASRGCGRGARAMRARQVFAQRGGDARRLVAARPPARGELRQRRLGRAASRVDARRATSAAPSSSSLDDVLPGADLLRQLLPPGGEAIDPAFDRVLVARRARRPRTRACQRSLPSARHRRFAPRRLAARAGTARPRRRTSCPSAKMSASTTTVFADRPLDRKAPAVDLRRRRLRRRRGAAARVEVERPRPRRRSVVDAAFVYRQSTQSSILPIASDPSICSRKPSHQ